MTRDPEAMVSALRRISGRSAMMSVPSDLRQMFFDEPPGFLASVFSTHPSIEQRVRAIRVVTGTSDDPLPVTGSTRNPGVLAA
jgi:heat shock protein HtpX